jgi:hypothetical protein
MSSPEFNLDDEMVLLPWPYPVLDVALWLRQAYYRDGRAGVERLLAAAGATLDESPRPKPPAMVKPPSPPSSQSAASSASPSPAARPVSYPPTSPSSLPFRPVALSKEDVALLKDQLRKYEGVYRLFEMAAERSPEWVWKQEVEADIGMSATHLRNQLRSLTWLMTNLFGAAGTDDWPINYKRWGGVYFYRLDPTTAQWWREAD